MAYKTPFSHVHYDELDMKVSNVRGLRTDGLEKAGQRITLVAPYNIIPGVGSDEPGSRYVFDAYRDSTNKFRDTRRFAKMNNPDIPKGCFNNLITGEIQELKRPPPVLLNPRGEERPKLFTLSQVRPPSGGGGASRVTQGLRMTQGRGGGGVAEALGFVAQY